MKTSKIIMFLSVLSLTPAPVSTQTIEDVQVYEIELKFKTNTIKNAGTDDNVFVSLYRGRDDTPLYLDYARNDREEGSYEGYHLFPRSVSKISDITRLYIKKKDDDGWNIRSIELFINRHLVFRVDYGAGGHWLENSGDYEPRLLFTKEELRQNRAWRKATKSYVTAMMKPPDSISPEKLKSMIEGNVGSFVGSRKHLKFRRLDVKRANDNQLHVDVGLEWLKCGIQIDFDLNVSMNNGRVEYSASGLTKKAGCKLSEILGEEPSVIVDSIADRLSPRADAKVGQLTGIAINGYVCQSVKFTYAGGISFEWVQS